jgi:hypothetical protein
MKRKRGCLILFLLLALIAAAFLWLITRPPTEGRAADVAPGVAQFSGEPGLQLSQEERRDVAFGSVQVYSAQLANGDPVWFDVDTETGEVRSFSRHQQPGQTVRVDLATAQETAIEFARKHYAAPDLLKEKPAQAKLIDHGEGSKKYYSFWWVRTDPQSGAYLPQEVQVRVNAQTGKVDSYSSLNVPVTVSTRPAINKERAIQEALKAAQGLEGARIAATTLFVSTMPVFEPNGEQALLWCIVVEGTADPSGYTPGAFVFLDAQSGKVVSMEPYL